MSKPLSLGTPAGDRDDTTPTALPAWPLASLCLAMLMSSLDTSIANAALPVLSRAFGAPFQHVQWIVLAYLLALTTMLVSVGRLGDIAGRRRLLLGGMGLFTVASLACGLAPTLPVLLFARGAQGLGAAGMMALAVALVADIVPKAGTGRAMGLLGTVSAIGTTLGPALGGVLTARFGWGAIFLVNVPIGVVAMLLAYRHLPDERPIPLARTTGVDVAGTLLLVATLGAYALALTLGRGQWGLLNAALVSVAVFGAGAFMFVEGRRASPLIDIAMLCDPTVGASLATGALVSTVMMTTLVVGPFYLSRALGLSASGVGLALSVGPLVAALTGVPSGRMVDRLGARRMTIAGLAALAAGAAGVSALPGAFGIVGYLLPLAGMTAGYALFQAANNTVLMTGVRHEQRGVGAGLLSLARNLGLITGASAMGAVFALAVASGDVATASPDAVAAGTRITFEVAALVLGAALVVAIAGSVTAAWRHSNGRRAAQSRMTHQQPVVGGEGQR